MKEMKHKYELADGTPIPGVTTVTRLLDKPQLIHWAWQCGVDGRDYLMLRDEAATIGSAAHALIHAWVRGKAVDPSDITPNQLSQAHNCLNSFKDWWQQNKLILIASEISLVSEAWRYGGTPDLVVEWDGNIVLVDIKSGSRIYDEMLIQLASYNRLWDIHNPGKKKIDKCCLLRLNRDGSGLEQYLYNKLDDRYWQMFLSLLNIYNLQRELKYGN